MLKTKAILHRKDTKIEAHDCVVSKIVELGEHEFIRFSQNLLADYGFIAGNQSEMYMDKNGVSHCLLVLGEGHDDGILVRSEGTAYAQYSALLPHARRILQAQNMSPHLTELNQKMTTLADHAANEAEQQLMQSGKAELNLNDLGTEHGIDLHGNQILWDAAANMVAERLDDQGLELETDKDMLTFTDPDIQSIIEVCEEKIPFDPLVAPTDQQWGIKRIAAVDELIEQFQHDNWAARTGFVLDNLAFVEQVSGGDEWLALKFDGERWQSFDSISFGHMIDQSDVDYCRQHIEYLATASSHELLSQPESNSYAIAKWQAGGDVPEAQMQLFEQIANKNCFIKTLTERKRDSLDFHEVSVWGLKAALEEAYLAGMNAQAQQIDGPRQQADSPEPEQDLGPTLGM